MENHIVSVRNLRYSYGGEREILKGINVDIEEGQRVAVIGTNGAGKSTFFSRHFFAAEINFTFIGLENPVQI